MEASYRLGIVEALAAFAAQRLSPTDYVDSCLARTAAVEPRVHAFAHVDADAVCSRAATVAPGKLAGIPIGLKDIIDTAGIPTEMGSPAFEGHVPERSAVVVDALTTAGAVVFGKTVTTEFAWRQPGATRNPWHPGHTPGGSSSGSAAAVAYGAVPGALGTQTLGSVLRPAAFCGVVGYKPSFGAIPRTGVYPLASSLDHIGVFARQVADAALLASVLVAKPAWPLRDATPPRIAFWRTPVWDRASAEQRGVVESIAARLAAAGATVVAFELPAAFDVLWSTAATICDVEGGRVNASLAADSPPRISAHTIALVERGARVAALDYDRALQTQRALIDAFAPLAEPFDAILMAPALGEAPPGLDDTGDAVFCTPASLLGAPAIALPAGRSGNGLPLGIQLVGAYGEDLRLLEAAQWVERVIAWTAGFPLA